MNDDKDSTAYNGRQYRIINWKKITRNTYTHGKPDVRKYILNKSLTKVQFNNAIRKNMVETESNNEWNELPANIKNLLVAFVKETYLAGLQDPCIRKRSQHYAERNSNDSLNDKISFILKNRAKTFTQNSETFTLDENANELTLAQIRDKECAGDDIITMIAVTRNQHDANTFPKYVNYIKKNNLGTGAIYYGLWSDGYDTGDVEFDVLYVIPTDDHAQIQVHLNKHDNINKGTTQVVALMLLSDGTRKIIPNEKIRE